MSRPLRELFAGRRSLLWLCGPPVLFLGAIPLVNRVQPTVFGLPLFVAWLVLATLLTPVCIGAAAHGDPLWRSPADRGEQAE
jgi:uncharacterized protein DUF3311